MWKTTKRISASVWQAEPGTHNLISTSDIWLPFGTRLSEVINVSDKETLFLLQDGRIVGIRHDDEGGIARLPEGRI